MIIIVILICIICWAICSSKNSKCNELQQNIDALNKKNEGLQQSIELLLEENERLDEKAHPAYALIEQLHGKIKELRDVHSKLSADVCNKRDTANALKAKITELDDDIDKKSKIISTLNVELEANECGLYEPTFEFAHSSLYRVELTALRESQKQCITNNMAVKGNTSWTVNGDTKKGQAMVNDTAKLLLRAFNVSCDEIIRKITIANAQKSIQTIYKNASDISKLGRAMSIFITDQYVELKVREANLALDFKQKKQEEKEAQQALKAEEKERQIVQKEIEAAQKELQKEQSHYENALKNLEEQIVKNGANEDLIAKKEQIEAKIQEVENAIETVNNRDANYKAGYVYIISNIGAFGENIFKIGMTRRLDPQERVDELGDASVPFGFDVHAMIFSEDAPGLEAALHKAFEDKKVNKINSRKEFFNVTLDEIKAEVSKNFDKTVEWNDVASAEQYRQSLLLSNVN